MATIVREKLTNEIVLTHPADVLIEDFYPGQPLVISFAYVNWKGNPGFDFFGRVKKLESLCGQSINKIYLRDRTASWYQNGVPGLGGNVQEAVHSLNTIVHQLQPSRVITIGQSMGAYGALLFGLLLPVDQIVTFAGLSTINPQLAKLWNDQRYLSAMQKVQLSPTPHKQFDLLPLLRDRNVHQNRPQIDIYFGTFPSDVASAANVPLNHGAVHVDALHAERIGAAYPKCRLHPHPNVSHLIAQHLIETTEMDAILRRHILDEESASPTNSVPDQRGRGAS